MFLIRLLFLLCFTSLASAQQVALNYNVSGSGNYYPYYSDDSINPGILPELIEHIFETANIKGQHVELPAKRTVKYLQQGLIDFDVMSPAWLSEQEKNNPLYIYSDTLLPVNEYLVSLVANRKQWQSTQALQNKNVGTVLGYYYHNDSDFTRIDFKSERELMLALDKKRVAVAILDEVVASYWASQLNIDISIGAQHSSGFLRIRLRNEHHAFLAVINDAIDQLKNDGTISKISNKYLNTSEK